MGIYSGLNYNCVIKIRLLQTPIRMSFPIRLFSHGTNTLSAPSFSIYRFGLPIFLALERENERASKAGEHVKKNNIFATVCKSNLRECYCCAFKCLPFFFLSFVHVNDTKLNGGKKKRACNCRQIQFGKKAMLATTNSLSAHFYGFIFILAAALSCAKNFAHFFFPQ